MLVFATETSCDETSVCLMEDKKIIEHVIFSQKIHKKHGGVVPELASRSHLDRLQDITMNFLGKNYMLNNFFVFHNAYRCFITRGFSCKNKHIDFVQYFLL